MTPAGGVVKIHSISSKEEIKKKISPKKIANKPKKQNIITNNTNNNINNNNSNTNNKLLSSNYLFLTNDTDFHIKDENKKVKKNKNIKNYSNGEKLNIPELKDIFKKIYLKKL